MCWLQDFHASHFLSLEFQRRILLEENTDFLVKHKARVVISHHAPAVNPNTKYGNSELMPAFNSLDMLLIIEKYQPNIWVYGHTHECDDQTIGNTRIISNQRGYPRHFDACECEGFDESGVMIKI